MMNATNVVDQKPAVSEDAIGFPDGANVDVHEVDARRWRVLTAFEYQGASDIYTVPVGELTDFASVPRPFVWFIPTYGRYTKAAILHDHLCRLAHHGAFSRRDADGIFRQAMRTLDVAFLRRWIMWAAVRWGAAVTPSGRKDWWRDAWRVLLITGLILPILLPAVLVVVLTLVVWFVIEWIVWVPLKFGEAARRRAGSSRKRVNTPRLTFRL